jgi:hypothetical protein
MFKANSPYLWALIWPCKPLFCPQFECSCKVRGNWVPCNQWNWVSVHKICRVLFWQDFDWMKNMSHSQGPGKGNLIQNWVQNSCNEEQCEKTSFVPSFLSFFLVYSISSPVLAKLDSAPPSLEHFMDNPLVPILWMWDFPNFQEGFLPKVNKEPITQRFQAHHQHQLQLF